MLGIGFKVSDTPAAAVERPLREFLEREYASPPPPPASSSSSSSSSAELSAVQTQALEQFARLKSDVDLVRTPSSMSRHVLLRYYAQLERMTARFPHDIPRLAFTWNDSFCPRKKITQSSLFFEMAAVLFNYGALESQLGVQTDRSDADGLKTACRHFMLAAGAFATVSEQLVDKCVGARTPDMSAEGLGMLAQLMLAQAQACFYEKAIKDQMKDAVKAKLVHQALELYTSALELCHSPQLHGTIDRTWAVHIHFQVVCTKAATQYWQARAAKDAALNKGIGYGEEIARLQIADAECAEVVKMGTQNKLPASLVQSARALQRVVQEQLQSARKDNASIYLENVPKASELPPVGKASLVKPLPLSPDEIAAELEGGVDLFDKFVPSALLRRAAEVKDQVQTMLTQASERVATSNEAAKAQLQTLGLPASIEAFEKTSDNGIPQGIWLKIAHMQSSVAGGDVVAATQQQLHANELASERAEKGLHGIETKLAHEEVEDNICRQNYGATRWARPPSATLNDGFRQDIDRYFRLVKEAKASDKVVAIKLQANASLLALLAQRKPQLDAQLPPLQTDTSSCRDEIETLSRLLLQLSALLEEKDQVLQDFSASLAKFNVLPLLLRGGPSDAATDLALADEKKFFETHFVQKLEAVGADEAALLHEIHTANATFESKKAADQSMLARQAFLQQLSDAVDTSEQLQSHVKEGARFYEELHTRITQLQQTVDDHCAARDLERREMELNVQADNEMREREARDADVAAQMMRDLHLSGTPTPTPTNATSTANDEALARQLAGTTPQTFAGYASFAPSSSSSSAPPPQQQQPKYDFSRLQQQQQQPTRPPSAPYPQQPNQQHPYTAYQQAQQPPPAYSSVFASSPSSTPQFGNYYYAQQQQQQPQYPPQQPQYQPAYPQGSGAPPPPPPQANANHQYPPGAGYVRPPPRDSV